MKRSNITTAKVEHGVDTAWLVDHHTEDFTASYAVQHLSLIHILKGKTLGELVRDRMAAFPASGEINSKLAQQMCIRDRSCPASRQNPLFQDRFSG